MISNLFRYFSLRYLFMNPVRTILTFLGVSLGSSLFLSILLINDATVRSFEDSIESMTGKADLTITADGMGFEESVAATLSSVTGIKSVVPMVINFAYLEDERGLEGQRNTPIIFLGIDLLKDSAVREYNTSGEDIVPDPLAFVNQADSIIATKSWSKKHGKLLEDTIELQTKEGLKTFAVRGFIDDVGPAKAFNGNMAIMDIDGARFNFGRDGLYDRVDVILDHGSNVQEKKKEIKGLLGPRFKVEDKQDQSSSMQQMVKSMQDLSSFLGFISFFVGCLIIVNTVNTAVSQRRKDIGSLRAFGAEKKHIIALFAGEFIFLALMSSLFGSFLGNLIAEFSLQKIAEGLSASLLTSLPPMKIVFTLKHLAQGLVLGFLSSSVALVYPLYQALKIHPIEAIKPAEVDFDLDSRSKMKPWKLGSVLGAALFLSTIIVAVASGHNDLLQDKKLQPLILVSGLFGMLLLGPFLVLTALNLLHKLPLPFLLNFSLANLLKTPSRTASTSIHLFLGFMLVIIVTGINVSFQETIMKWAGQITKMPQIVNVTSWGNLAGLQVQPLHESTMDRLLKLKHLNHKLGSPVIGSRIVHINIGDRKFTLKSFDDSRDSALYDFFDPISGSTQDLGTKLFDPQTNTILISEPMTKLFKKKTGDVFTLDTPAGTQDFIIGGIVRDFASPNGVIYMRRDLYKKFWKDHLVTMFILHHDASVTSAKFLESAEGELVEEHLMITLPEEIKKNVETNLRNNMALSDSTKWICLLVGMLGLLNSFLIGVLQRFRELGGMRSIGMSRVQMLFMVLFETLLLGVTGIMVAFFLSLPMTYCWVNWTLSYFLGWKVDFYFSGSDFVILFVVGILVSGLSGLMPAIKASRLKLREALEYE